jgi:hypothetical protein
MKGKIFSMLFVLIAAMPVMADDTIEVVSTVVAPRVNLLEQMPNVEVIQDSAVATLLDGAINGTREWVEIEGYRVQIYSSNQQQTAKGEALDLEEKLQSQVNQTIYVQYIPPFWKVRLGDFRTYEEAKEYKKLFVQQFPDLTGDTYIVRDKIKVLQ